MTLALLLLACGPDAPGTTNGTTTATPTTTGTTTTTTTTGTTVPTGWDPRLDAFVAALEADMPLFDAPGVAAVVREGGVVIGAIGLGVRDRRADDPVTPDTLFRIGSTTKQMVSVLALQEVEAGKLTLDTTLDRAIPEFSFDSDPTWNEAIDLWNCLTHTHAMYDYLEIEDAWSDDAVAGFFADGAVFPDYAFVMADVGAFWNYSNPGFIAAGRAAEITTGRVTRELLEERLFVPLGMERSLVRGEDVEADGNYAVGWGADPLGVTASYKNLDPTAYELASALPAGGVWSSPVEMTLWADFVLRGNPAVLDDAAREASWTPQVSLDYWDDYDYGYGLFLSTGNFDASGQWWDFRLVDHGGDINGYASDLWILPDADVTVSVLSNVSGGHFTYALVELAKAFGAEPGTGPDLSFDTTTLEEVAGVWNDPWNVGELNVTVDDGALAVSAPLLDSYGVPYDAALVPYWTDNYGWEVQGYPFLVTFIRDDAGNPVWLRTRSFVAGRQQTLGPPEREPDVEGWLRRLATTPDTTPSAVRALLESRR